MATNRLKWILDADASRFQKGMARARKALSALKTGFLVAAGAGGAVAAFVKSALNTADALGKTSRAVGLSVESLQELQFAAERSGVSQGQLNSAMQSFSNRVGQARLGLGALNSHLKKYDKRLLLSINSSNSQSEALDLIAEAVKKAGTETDRTAIITAAFGRANAGMVEILRNGKEGLDAFRQAARDNTTILSKEMTDGAERANDAISDLSKAISTAGTAFGAHFAPEIEKAARALKGFILLLPGLARATADAASGALAHVLAVAASISGNQKLAESLKSIGGDLQRSSGSGFFDELQGKNAGVGQMEFGGGEPQKIEDPKGNELTLDQNQVLKEQTTVLIEMRDGIKTLVNAPAIAG